MTTPEFNINNEAQQCIDEHLDAIDDALRSNGISRSERQHVLDDVQTQILEMLADRCEGAPNEQDVVAVLAELDPPESYAEETGMSAPSDESRPSPRPVVTGSADGAPSPNWYRRAALIMAISGIVVPALMAWISDLCGRKFGDEAIVIGLVMEFAAMFIFASTYITSLDRAALACVVASFLSPAFGNLMGVPLTMRQEQGRILCLWPNGAIFFALFTASVVFGLLSRKRPLGRGVLVFDAVVLIIGAVILKLVTTSWNLP